MKNQWILEALTATAAYATAALLDRYVLFGRRISAYYYFLCNGLVGLLIAIGGVLLAGREILFGVNALLGILAGILFGVFTLLYFQTIAEASPVSTAAFMQAVPVMSTFASPRFFSEPVSATSASALLLLCLGLSFISLIDRSSIHKVAPRMLPAVTVLSIGYVIQRIVLTDASTMAVLALNRVGNVFVSTAIFGVYKMRKMDMRPLLSSQRPVLIAGSIAGEALAVVGLFLSLRAYRVGRFPDVSAVLATLPVGILVGAWILHRFSKSAVWSVPELGPGSPLILTLVAVAAIVFSVYLISLA
jgi:drug/metabolite transporter (DMT)-like permease